MARSEPIRDVVQNSGYHTASGVRVIHSGGCERQVTVHGRGRLTFDVGQYTMVADPHGRCSAYVLIRWQWAWPGAAAGPASVYVCYSRSVRD